MRNKAIAYAMDFSSFLIESGIEPTNIILFGSAVSGSLDKDSDIDIFVDIKPETERDVRSALKMFEGAFGEMWKLKGINNPISLKVGNLREWPDLKRSIQSYGILLYGKYEEPPKNMRSYLMFRLDFSRMARARKVSAWRKLYGYTQKVGKKKYTKRGIIEAVGGLKIEKGVVLIPPMESKGFKDFLSKNKIVFLVNEVWSDGI